MAAELILIVGFTVAWAWLNWASRSLATPGSPRRHESGMA